MKIPWFWIKEKILNKESLSEKDFLEKLNYFGLECEKVLDENKNTFISFVIPSNRKDMKCWYGILQEISFLLKIKNFQVNFNEKFFNTKIEKFEDENFKISENELIRKNGFSYFFLELYEIKNEIFPLIKLESPFFNSYNKTEKKFEDSLSSLIFLMLLQTKKKINIAKKLKINSFVLELPSFEDNNLKLFNAKSFLILFLENLENFFDFELKKIYLDENFDYKYKNSLIEIKHEYIKEKIGTSINKKIISEIFLRLNFEILKIDKENTYLLSIPPYRFDISQREDIVEEVGKIFDYNKIKGLPSAIFNEYSGEIFSLESDLKMKLSMYLISLGFQEIMTYSLVEKDNLIKGKEKSYFEVSNRKNSKNSLFYRQFVFPEHLKNFKTNYGKGFDQSFSFEFSNIYLKNKNEKLVSKKVLSIFANGEIFSNKMNYLINQKIVEKILIILKIKEKVNFKKNNFEFLEEKSSNEIIFKDKKIGFLGEIKETFFQNKKVSEVQNETGKSFICEIYLDEAFKLYKENSLSNYKEFSKSPIMKKDFSFFVSKEISSDQILEEINKNFEKKFFLFSSEIIDIYEDKSFPEMRSICFRVKFGKLEKDQIFTNESIKDETQELLESLDKKFKIIRR